MVAAYPTTPPAVPIPIPDITPVNSLPSPLNLVAVMIPAPGLSSVILPAEEIVTAVPTTKLVPSKVRFASPFKLVPLPPVITLLSALLLIVAEPAAP